MILTLSYPPSLNSYYRTVNGRIIISKKGREYRSAVALELLLQDLTIFGKARLNVIISAFMPDNRRRDLDNMLKCVLDALQKNGVYDDDSQIDHLAITRVHYTKEQEPRLVIDITEIEPAISRLNDNKKRIKVDIKDL